MNNLDILFNTLMKDTKKQRENSVVSKINKFTSTQPKKDYDKELILSKPVSTKMETASSEYVWESFE